MQKAIINHRNSDKNLTALRVTGSSISDFPTRHVMSDDLIFNDTRFDVVDRNGQPWLRSPQIAGALGYAKADRVFDLYTRHADEFTDSMTAIVTLPTPGGPQETRIYSLRGCHLLAMFARTPKAKAFRVWVLDVLEALNEAETCQPQLEATPQLDSPLTPEQCRTIQNMVDALAGKGMKHAAVYARFKNHFRIARYDQLPQSRMNEAIAYLMGLDLQKALPAVAEQSPAKQLDALYARLRSVTREAYDIGSDICRVANQSARRKMNLVDGRRTAILKATSAHENMLYAHDRMLEAMQKQAETLMVVEDL